MKRKRSAVNDQHDIRLRMLTAVSAVLWEYSSVWNVSSGFQSVVNELDAIVDTVQKAMQVKVAPASRSTELKKQCKENLMDLMLETSGALYEYARREHDEEISGLGKLFRKHLMRLREEALLALAKEFARVVNQKGIDLQQYGADVQLLDELSTATVHFEESITYWLASKSARKAATKMIPANLKQAAKVLSHSVDKLMVRYKRRQPEFYARYHAVRRLVHTGARHAKNPEAEQVAA